MEINTETLHLGTALQCSEETLRCSQKTHILDLAQ